MQNKLKVLYVVPPNWLTHAGIFNWERNLGHVKHDVDKYVSDQETVTTMDEYNSLSDERKTSFDLICVQMGTIAPNVIENQI